MGTTADHNKPITAPVDLETQAPLHKPQAFAQRFSDLPLSQRLAGGFAVLGLLALLGFVFGAESEPEQTELKLTVEVDANLAKWLEKEALKIRKREAAKTGTPSVVRHFERAPDPIREYVEVSVSQGPAQFTLASSGKSSVRSSNRVQSTHR